ncbi:MAG: nucleotide sugar dehydrogenase [Candidatus Parvarchaeum sp.]|nr:nucleotide sugar dehydrogenase [Candidatus Parvarchaeum tengchongense]
MKTLVVGLGRVGLPHALISAKNGNKVIGYDKNLNLIIELQNRRLPFIEKDMKNLLQSTLNKSFFPKDNLNKEDWNSIEIIILTIGVDPFKKGNSFDNFWSVISSFCKLGLKGKTIVFRTTLPIGTIDKVKEFIRKRTSLNPEKDYFLGFWPERIVEGVAIKEELTLPRVVGTYSDKGFEIISKYIKSISDAPIIRVSNPKTAEFIKLLDNSYRSTMFAFSNDVAIAADNVGVDIFEALNAANSNYPRNSIKMPSVGIGGYCLTKDPYFLELSFPTLKRRELKHSVWWYSRKISDEMPNYILAKVSSILKKYNLNKVLVLGITYKEDADDTRLSPSLYLAKSLSK